MTNQKNRLFSFSRLSISLSGQKVRPPEGEGDDFIYRFPDHLVFALIWMEGSLSVSLVPPEFRFFD